MRRFLILLALLLALAPTSSGAVGNPVFGQAWCKPTFRCPAAYDTASLQSLMPHIVTTANTCIAGSFGMRDPSGYFEDTLGLDSSLCLTTKPIPQAQEGLTMTPVCCIQPVQGNDDYCQIICTQYGMR